MTAKEAANLIGKQASLTLKDERGTLEVPVTIQDAREHFGRVDVLVTPIGGSGSRWVSAERVKITGGAP